MAEEEKELSLDVGEDGEEKPKSKLVIIIIIVIVLLAVIGGAVFFLMGGEEEPIEEAPLEEEIVVESKQAAIYVPVKPAMVVNFASPGSSRFLQVELSLMTRDQEVVNLIELHLPLIRNNLILLFSSQEFDQVMAPEGKANLREAALSEVQKIIEQEHGSPGVEQVLFTSFVVQ